MASPKSDIPVGTQFSPGLIDLPTFLRAAVKHSGNQDALRKAIWNAPVQLKNPGKVGTRRTQNLPLEAAVQYGLLAPKTYEATDLARLLVKLPEPLMFDEFARHILLSLNGLRVVEGAQQMAMDEPLTGIKVTGDSLARYLSDQGLRVTVHNTAINTMRMWLARAGIFPETGRADAWVVNEEAKRRILGLDDAQITAIAGWSEDHQSLALALCQIGPKGWTPASKVREVAEMIRGRPLPRDSLPKLFQPLASTGFVDVDAGKGTSGGKTAKVRTTKEFQAEVLGPFLTNAADQLDAGLLELYKMDASDIKRDLRSSDAFAKGLALEAYAIRVMRLLGLRFIQWRARARNFTGNAEVDLVLAGALGGIPTRWQVQCKNTPSKKVPLEDVAKEVGIAPLTKATHILILANSDYTDDARTYARAAMENSPLTIFLLGKKEFDKVLESSGAELPSILRDQSERIVEMHRKGMEWASKS